MKTRLITPEDNLLIADIIRDNLKKHQLDIPGTVYFDDNLNQLTDFYNEKPDKRRYYIALDDNDNIIGGIGLAEFEGFDNCAELQKLYLVDEYKGRGYGRELFELACRAANEMGYRLAYLETHTNLDKAIILYEKCGFRLIDKPDCVVHGTMNRFYIKEL